MASRAIPGDLIPLGRAVLLATDALGFAPQAGLWIEDPKNEKWDFVLVSKLFEEMQGREIFLRLNRALGKMFSEEELSRFSLYIAGPSEALVETIESQVGETGAYASVPLSYTLDLGGESVQSIVYRFATATAPGRAATPDQFRTRSGEMELA